MAVALSKNIRILSDAEAVAKTAARIFSSAASVAVGSRSSFSVALSGGSTPTLLYRILGSSFQDVISWQHVHLFWTDERCVPADHKQSNFRIVNEELLSHIDMPNGNIHRIKGELAPDEGAGTYETELRGHFGREGLPRFNVIFLGIGEDGHTASLFPGSEALGEEQRLAVPAYSMEASSWRVTLTLPVLNNAGLVVFLVTGSNKAEIMAKLFSKEDRSSYPAGLVNPLNGRVIWLIDKDAASGLDSAGQ